MLTNIGKRTLSFVMALVMLFSMVPVQAFATEEEHDHEHVEETVVALGMIPAEKAPVVALEVNVPEQKPEYTAWGDFLWSLSCLFGE